MQYGMRNKHSSGKGITMATIQQALQHVQEGDTFCGVVVRKHDVLALQAIQRAINVCTTMQQVRTMLQYNTPALEWIERINGRTT
jgi:hypothetical protein